MPYSIKRPVFRFRITTPKGVLRWATRDLDDDVVPYHGVVIDVSEPEQRIGEPLSRVLDTPRLTLRVTDRRLRWVPEHRYLFQGARLEAERYDRNTGQVYARFCGTITRPSIPQDCQVALEAENLKRETLRQEIPTLKITTARFPTARPEAIGQTIPLVIGHALNHPLYIVHDDLPGNTCDGLLGVTAHGGPLTVTQVRSDGVGGLWPFDAVGAGEYTVTTRVDALGTTWQVVRFTPRQLRHGQSTEFHQLWADVTSTNRNPATNYMGLLANPLWSVGEPVNAASFAAAAAVYDQLGYKADGMVWKPTPLQDVLRRLQLRGMMPDTNAAGEWIVTVDTPPTGTPLELGTGPGDGLRNLVACTRREPTRDPVRDLILEYELNEPFADTATFEARREVSQANGFGARGGTDLTIRPMIRDPATADMEADYWAKTLRFGDETAEVEMLQEAAGLTVGALVRVTAPRMGYVARTLRLRAFGDPLTRLRGLVQGYDPSIFVYTAQPLPSSPAAGSNVDYSRTPPDPVTSLAISSQGVEIGTNGLVVGYFILSCTVPATNFGHAQAGAKRSDGSVFVYGSPIYTTGAGQLLKITGLTPGKDHDLTVRVVNQFDLVSSGDPVLSARPSSTNTTAPSTPTGLTVVAATGQSVSLDWADNPEPDVVSGGGYQVFRDGVKIFTVSASRCIDAQVALGTTYAYAIKARNNSGAVSAATASINATPTGVAQGTTPGTPSAPTFVSETSYQASDGPTRAAIRIAMPAMPTEGAYMNALIRAASQTVWQVKSQETAGSGQVRVDDLTPGFQYEFAAQAFNAFGKPSAVSATLTRTAPGDTTPPNIPTFTLDTSVLRMLTLRVTSARPDDHGWYEYELRTASSAQDGTGQGSVVKSGRFDGTLTVTAAEIGYGSGNTRHLRIRNKDLSKNPATADGTGAKWTATSSFFFTEAGNVDLGAGSVTTPTIGGNAVSEVSTVANINDPADTRSGTEAEAQISGMSLSKTLAVAASPVLVNLTSVAMKLKNNAGTPFPSRKVKVVLSAKRGSSYLLAGRFEVEQPAGKDVTIPMTMAIVDSPGSVGPHTYAAYWQLDDGNSGTTDAYAETGPIYMQATEIKK